MNVLFVDEDVDVEIMHRIICRQFPNDSFVLADTLKEAVQHIWHEKFDILVIDMWMPADEEAVPGSGRLSGRDAGMALINNICGDTKCINHDTPYIVFSGLVPSEDPRIRRFWEEHEARWFRKPMLPSEMHAVLLGIVGEGP